MSEILEIPCPCGRTLKRERSAVGTEIRCYYCGASVPLEPTGGGHDRVPDAGTKVTAEDLFASLQTQGPIAETPSDCRSCGAALQVSTGDLEAGFSACPYCAATTPFPGRGASHTQVVERDGERREEHVTVWEGGGGSGEPGPPAGFPDEIRDWLESNVPPGEHATTTTVEHREITDDPELGLRWTDGALQRKAKD